MAPALAGLALLLVCQLGGELFSRALAPSVPGPVLGLMALVSVLAIGLARAAIGAACDALLRHLSLLFVPVGVGVVTHLDRVVPHGLSLAVVLLASTWIGLVVSAMVLRAFRRGG